MCIGGLFFVGIYLKNSLYNTLFITVNICSFIHLISNSICAVKRLVRDVLNQSVARQ